MCWNSNRVCDCHACERALPLFGSVSSQHRGQSEKNLSEWIESVSLLSPLPPLRLGNSTAMAVLPTVDLDGHGRLVVRVGGEHLPRQRIRAEASVRDRCKERESG